MKKKIGDLTLKEVQEICNKGCDNCPRKLVAVCKKLGFYLCMLENLDKEIEVEEDETYRKN